MHIPDGFVDIPTAVATGALSLAVVAYSVRKTSRELGDRTVPLLGVTAAFVFAAQMLNFPVAGGTSGHFLGATLAMLLLGPWAAAIVMTAVLVVQALGMADGGITALGANVLNMGVVAVFAGYGLFHLLERLLPRTIAGRLAAAAAASWASVVLASAACALELALSGTTPVKVALPAMLSVHMIIGLGEALITTAVVSAVVAARPDLVKGFSVPPPAAPQAVGAAVTPTAAVTGAPIPPAPVSQTTGRARLWAFVAGALVIAGALAVFIAPFASSSPDGLERVAADQGFESAAAAQPAWSLSPLGDYQFPGIGSDKTATAVAGLVGTLALFALVLLIGRALGRRRLPSAGPDGPA
jgi:cobalt/nickel transport system permease protein